MMLRIAAGFMFVLIVVYTVMTLIFDIFTPATSIVAGICIWSALFVWRNLGGGNPVLARIRDLEDQIEFAKQDIDAMNEQKVPGRRSEIKYLNSKIDEWHKEIRELEHYEEK